MEPEIQRGWIMVNRKNPQGKTRILFESFIIGLRTNASKDKNTQVVQLNNAPIGFAIAPILQGSICSSVCYAKSSRQSIGHGWLVNVCQININTVHDFLFT